MAHDLSRRALLGAGSLVFAPAAWLVTGCARTGPPASTDAASPPRPDRAPAAPAPAPSTASAPYGPGPATKPEAAPSEAPCLLTAANIEGPYYRAGAPMRSDLADAKTPGTPLVIEGKVLAAGCDSPVADVLLDVWQANADGHYDNDGTAAPGALFMRGRLRADASGAFLIKTVVPGRYLNGPKYRPAHVHVKLAAPGFAPLTTQLYFPGDPYNDTDPFIVRSLIMALKDDAGVRVAHYDFVLKRAT